jgi:hypothetical protein
MKQPLIIPIYRGRELYQGIEDYDFMVLGHHEFIRKGYVCDGASVPRLAWWFLPPDGSHRAASYEHDGLYDTRGLLCDGGQITKAEVDLHFRSRLLELGTIAPWRVGVIYKAVKLGGARAWNSGDGTRLILPIINETPQKSERVLQGHLCASRRRFWQPRHPFALAYS